MQAQVFEMAKDSNGDLSYTGSDESRLVSFLAEECDDLDGLNADEYVIKHCPKRYGGNRT
jgi:hypothetical protein